MKTIPVSDIKKVDPTRYIEGDVFIGDKQIGILHQGKVEPLVMQKDVKDFVKKKDVQKMINDARKEKSE